MHFDHTHKPWLIALLLMVFPAGGIYWALPAGAASGTWEGLAFAAAGTALALFCGLLPVRRKLQRNRRLSQWLMLHLPTWEKGHIYFGLLSCVLLHCHAGFRKGGLLTSILLAVLWAIILSGLVGLLFRNLLVLVKAGKGPQATGKGLAAARIIAAGHLLSQQLHIPLTLTLLGLAAVHAVMALFY